MQLQGKHVVLTGATGGIGRAIAERLDAQGARLLRTDHDGAIEVRLAPGAVAVAAARARAPRYWHAAPPP